MVTVTLLLPLLPARPAAAQGSREFTRQEVLVNTFESVDPRLGRQAASAIRGRVQRLYSRRDVVVAAAGDATVLLAGSGIDVGRPLVGGALTGVARALRSDEILSGSVMTLRDGSVQLEGRLSLVRDERLVQPLPAVRAPTLDSAATLFAGEVEVAREQLPAHRRCENSARELQFQRAIDTARLGLVAGTPQAILRTCLVTSLVQIGGDARQVLREADVVLAVTPQSYWALESAASAYDALGDKAKAGAHWLRLAATDSFNVDLTRRVVRALVRGGNSRLARPLAERLSNADPDDIAMLRLRWQAVFTLREWREAATVGEKLMARDAESRDDSTFVLQLASATRLAGDSVQALALVAQGVLRFPGDGRLYAFYAQAVQGEATVAAARGIGRFPEVAELQLLQSQEQRRSGRADDALESLRKALVLDSTLNQGFLLLAQAQAEHGEPDSALVSVHRALAAGDDSVLVAQFALSRGNVLYRAANQTKERHDFSTAMRFLAFADSVHATPQSQFLFGVTALLVSQGAATDAPKTNECELSRLASALLPLAREKLTLGAAVAPDAARQYLAYVEQLEPIVRQQIEAL
ncbi:MAG: hypothetical protein ABI910_21480, partial [Gemmatimonadota bacterium]